MALRFWSALFLACGLCLLATGSARAVAFVVDNCTSESPLRLAIQQIAADPDGGTLSFSCGSEPVTIVLSEGALPLITTDAVVDGGGLVTISGGGQSRVFTVGTEGKLTLRNIRIVDGFPGPRDGGAVASLGTLVLQNTIFEGNHTPETHSGGAIVSYGSLEIAASRFISNEAGGAGAIYVRFPGATASLVDSYFAGNRAVSLLEGKGGAIQVGDGARLIITRSTFERNRASMGGAVYIEQGSTLSVEGSYMADNVATADGGAVYFLGSFRASRSLFARNTASRGGALFAGATLTMTNSTLDSNEAGQGGALYVGDGASAAEVSVRSSTISANYAPTAGSALAVAEGSVLFRNTILGENYGSADCSIVAPGQGSFASDGANLADDPSCGLNAASDRIAGDLALAPLAHGTGATPVRRPLPGSPAIDSGACDVTIATDQRGVTRPQGTVCDVGAVEVRSFALTVKVTGNGTVDSQALDFACAATCTDTFPEGTQVALEAAPASGYKFAGWAGACTGTGSCTVAMENHVAVQATFQNDPPSETPPPMYSLTIQRLGGGQVVSEPSGILCGSSCSHEYSVGTQVLLAAEPTQGNVFSGWGSACTGSAACTITLTEDMTVTAAFAPLTPTGTPEYQVFIPEVVK